MLEKLYTARSEACNFFRKEALLSLVSGTFPEIRVFQNPGSTPNQDKADSPTALSAGGEELSFKDGSGVIFAMEMMPDAVNARFGDALSRFKGLLSLRCTLH